MTNRHLTAKPSKKRLNSAASSNLKRESIQIHSYTESGDKHLDFTNLGINRIREMLESENEQEIITKLILCNNNLRSVPTEVVNLKNLSELNLTKNFIKCMNPGDTVGFPTELAKLNLKTLILSECSLTHVPPTVWILKTLRILDLSKNPKLSEILPEVGYLESMISFNISHTGITSLPLDIGKCLDLMELILWGCKISSLPDTLKRLPKLRDIKMDMGKLCGPISEAQLRKIRSGQDSEHFPHFIFECEALQELSLGRISINSVGTVRTFELMELILNHNYFQEVPKVFLTLENLQVLDMSYNRIKVFPDSENQIKSLRKLFLAGNLIKLLPNSINNFETLEEFDLNFNKLKVLPHKIGFLKNLRRFLLRGNSLSSIPETISELTLLKTLDLSDNSISTIPEKLHLLSNIRNMHSFQGIDRTGLWLMGNYLKDVPKNLWKSNSSSCFFEYLRQSSVQKATKGRVRKVLVIGPPKSGKTSLVCNLIKHNSKFLPITDNHDVCGVFRLFSANKITFYLYDVKFREDFVEFLQFYKSPKALILFVFNIENFKDSSDQIHSLLRILYLNCPDARLALVGATKNENNLNSNLAGNFENSDFILQNVADYLEELKNELSSSLENYGEDSIIPLDKYRAHLEKVLKNELKLVNCGVIITNFTDTLFPWREPFEKTLERIENLGFHGDGRIFPLNWEHALNRLKNGWDLFVTLEEAQEVAEIEKIRDCKAWLNSLWQNGRILLFKSPVVVIRPRSFFQVVSQLFSVPFSASMLKKTWRYMCPTSSFEEAYSTFTERGLISQDLLKTRLLQAEVISFNPTAYLLETLNLIIACKKFHYLVPFYLRGLRGQDFADKPVKPSILGIQTIPYCWESLYRDFFEYFTTNLFSVYMEGYQLTAFNEDMKVELKSVGKRSRITVSGGKTTLNVLSGLSNIILSM